jgi:hypothetical protein
MWGYQALMAAVAAGQVAGIAVYDLSRLFRNARLVLDLAHEIERRQVPLLVANLPGARFDGATGRYMFGQLCLANQRRLGPNYGTDSTLLGARLRAANAHASRPDWSSSRSSTAGATSAIGNTRPSGTRSRPPWLNCQTATA